ncbi:ArsB/NhaD family transporter [Salinispira pacifica]
MLAPAQFWIGITVLGLTLSSILVRPFGIPEWAAALGGGVLMVVAGVVTPADAVRSISGSWNLFGFFLGLMAISCFADDAGVFEAITRQLAVLAHGSGRRLYFLTFAAGSLVTAFLSNDATALILTPVVLTLVTRLRLPVMPFMFACTFVADSASFLLPVSNPVNLVVLSATPEGLGGFFVHLFPAAAVVVAMNWALFDLLFRRELAQSYQSDLAETFVPSNRRHFRLTVIVLCAVGPAYIGASAFSIPVSLVALAGGALLATGSAIFRRSPLRLLREGVNPQVFGFVAGMLVLVDGLTRLGIANRAADLLIGLAGRGTPCGYLAAAFGAAAGANLVNNLPMAMILTAVITHASALSDHMRQGLSYATILGSDLGPNLTTIGSLATMLWLLLVRRRGFEVSVREYVKLGALFVPPALAVGALLIWTTM